MSGPARELRVEELVEAALELGVETFTMKDVARHIGVSHQVLYRWVVGRDEVLDLVADHLIEQITPPPLEDGDWRRWLVDFALQLRRELLATPGMALRGLTRHHVSAAFVRLHARSVEALTSSGMPTEQAVLAVEAYGTAVLGWIAREQDLLEQRQSGRRFADELQAARDVPVSATPRRRPSPDERYADFVETVVAGIAARAAMPATIVRTNAS